MYKTYKKVRKIPFNANLKETKKNIIKYLMNSCQLKNPFPGKPVATLLLHEILQELYSKDQAKASAISRILNICPFTGRTRGFYNFAKMSRIEFKRVAGAGLLPGVRKASW